MNQTKKINVMVDALVRIAYTHKGYPNASPEGEIARKALHDVGIDEIDSFAIWTGETA